MKIHQIKLQGGYVCPHFELQQVQIQPGQGCCGRTMGDDFVPICGLTKGLCPGLIQCPRLDVQTKAELIKKWRADINSKSLLDPKVLLK